MLTSLSPENRIRNRLHELGVTEWFLCKLDGDIGTTRLSRALNGLQDLTGPEAIRLLGLTSKLIELRDAFVPIPINWSNPRGIEYLLAHLTASPEQIKDSVSKWFDNPPQGEEL